MKRKHRRRIILTLCVLAAASLVFKPFFENGRREVMAAFLWGEGSGRPKVILDAGHGGPDGGAKSAEGIKEKDINLEIALNLRRYLTFFGFDVIMIREDDVSIHDPDKNTIKEQKSSDLKNRLAISKNYPDSLFLSIHLNAFPDKSQHGAQTFYSSAHPQSRLLAEQMQATLVEILDPSNHRKAKENDRDVFLMKNITSPAVLVECGFLSNADEARLLNSPEYRSKVAFALCMSLLNYRSSPPAKGGGQSPQIKDVK